jgi:hypothetical protein
VSYKEIGEPKRRANNDGFLKTTGVKQYQSDLNKIVFSGGETNLKVKILEI